MDTDFWSSLLLFDPNGQKFSWLTWTSLPLLVDAKTTPLYWQKASFANARDSKVAVHCDEIFI